MKHSVLFKGFAAALLAGASLAAQASPSTNAVDVLAGYDYSFQDNSFFTIVNNSTYTLSNIVFSAVGEDGPVSMSWASSIVGGTSSTQFFNGGAGYNGGFTTSYFRYYTENNQSYTLSFDVAGHGRFTTGAFSPTSNASGSFVGFLGNDVAGNAAFANASGFVAGIAAVPEPAEWLMLLAGVAVILVPVVRSAGKARLEDAVGA